MTFQQQLKEAKEKELINRLTRDIIFILLGLTFLIISFISAYNKDKKENKNNTKVNIMTKESK